VSDVLLGVRDLGVSYRVRGVDLPALHDVSFTIGRGEVVGLVGESGSGKSTVAAAVLGILARNGQITAGSVEFDGRDLTRLAPEAMRRVRGAEIAMIFQDPLGSLNPTIRVGRQIMEVAASHPEKSARSNAARRRRVLDLFAEVGIPDPEERFDYYPHQFSGGMQQRVMIAMALMLEPALIIADEATSALDVTLQAQILELFGEVRRRHGTSILLVSHDLGVIAQSCDQVSVMYAGRIIESATAQSLFAAPRHPYTRALIDVAPSYEDRGQPSRGIPGRVPGLDELGPGCAYAARCPQRHGPCDEHVPEMYPIGDRSVRCFLYWGGSRDGVAVIEGPRRGPVPVAQLPARALPAPVRATEPLVKVRGLCKSFDERRSLLTRLQRAERHPIQAVVDVDLDLRRGEIVGLVGESGSGKTTLALTLLRLVPATSGMIRFDGVDVPTLDRSGLRQLRRRMQIILQDPVGSLSPRLRVRTLLTEPYEINRTPLGDRIPAGELLGRVGLPVDLAEKYPAQLSGGQARRVSIARALALEPDLIIADEPTSGLDVSAAAGVLALMNDLREQLGITYLVITHDLNVVGQIADRLSVMYLGRIVESGTTSQIFEDPVHPYTQGLLAAVPRIETAGAREVERRRVPRGEMPSPRTPPPGCRFHTRCRLREEVCVVEAPADDQVDPDHTVACHLWPRARATRGDSSSVVAAEPAMWRP